MLVVVSIGDVNAEGSVVLIDASPTLADPILGLSSSVGEKPKN
jgi:hypothetical protein